MARRAMAAGVLCLLLAVGSARGDLTGELVDDSDNMANIVGARETMSLVDVKLHKVRAVGAGGRAGAVGRVCVCVCV